MIRLIFMRAARWVGLALALTFLGVGAEVQAQTSPGLPVAPRMERSFDLQLFHPAVGSRSFVTLDSASVLPHRLWHFGLVGSYGYQPLSYKLSNPDEPANPVTLAPVQSLAMAEVVTAMGIGNRFELGLALPVAFTWGGDGFDSYGRGTGGQALAVAVGDLRVEGKAELAGFGRTRNLLLGVSAGVTLPTAGQTAFLGERTVAGRARALLEYRRGEWLRALVMAGGLFRRESQFLGTPQGLAALYGAALELRPTSQMGVLCEATGRLASRYHDTNPAELDAGMRFYLPGMVNLLMGGGFGLNRGVGSPQARAYIGLGWAPDYRDRDGDGMIDRKDRCADEPEDWDSFQDEDGCPDPDNDGDGVPDAVDRCPNQAEDRDTFRDEDGCPDPDNDGDGIADLYDACPDAKEDGKGKRPTDGCPSTTEDADGDGIHDAADACPDDPEDKDGFQDEDGCPDPDNDGDGIPDLYDACPNEAEDPDGWQDEDGCPDPDNDHDGFADISDKCPNQPETINYYKDEDGCPDPGPELVRLGETDAKIFLAETIKFRTGAGGRPTLTVNSTMMIALVARVLAGHVEVSKVRIEVRGEDLSQEATQLRGEIVRDALVKQGIDPQRLSVVGLGRGKNRVELVIESRQERRRLPAVPAAPPDDEAAAPEAPPADGTIEKEAP